MALQTAPEFTDQSARALLEALPAAVVVCDGLGEVLYANAAAAGLLGPACARLQAKGQPIAPWCRAAAGETVEREVVELERLTGAIPVAVAARQAYYAGRAAAVAVISPLSERELELARSERLLNRVFLASPLAVALARCRSGTILNVNDRWLEFFGYRREEAIGSSAPALRMWACEVQRERVAGLLEAGRPVRGLEVQFARKDGTRRDALITVEFVEAGADPILLWMLTDITAGKAMRRDLDDATDRFKLFVETVQEYAIFLLDADGRVVTWNPGAQRMYGYAEREMLGQPITALHPPGERRGGARRLIAAALKSGRSSMQGWRVRKDGSRFWADAHLTALRDPDGRVRGFAKITRDLTERKKAEEAESLRRREEIQREVVANVSHELRTPIAAIRGFAETLLKGGLDDARNRRQFVQTIDRHAAHLSRLVEDILNLSALDGGGPGSAERLELSPIVEETVTGLEPLIRRRGLSVRLELQRELAVLADPHRLGQVLRNLLGNAVKYNRPRGAIVVSAERRKGMALVSVSDTGIGIPAAELPLLFERFRRTKAARAGKEKGTGLGLSISKRIVETWGGTIWAESGSSGSVFRFTVPLA